MATNAAALFSPKFRAFTAAGDPLAGGFVDVYLAGTTTRTSSYPTYNDAINGTNANANPVVLDANGEGNIWLPTLATGGAYKLVLSNAASVVQWTIDNYYPATSFNTTSVSEWIQDTNTVTRLSATQVKFTGVDTTATYHVGRRVKVLGSPSGYATVTASAFVTDTTVTLVFDSGFVMPNPLLGIQYGITAYNRPSYLDPRTALSVVKSGTQTGFSGGAKVTTWTVERDRLSEWSAANNQWVATYPGDYLITFTAEVSDTGSAQAVNQYIIKNGEAIGSAHGLSVGYTHATATNHTTHTAVHMLNLAAGDTIQAWLAGTANLSIYGTVTSQLSVIRIS